MAANEDGKSSTFLPYLSWIYLRRLQLLLQCFGRIQFENEVAMLGIIFLQKLGYMKVFIKISDNQVRKASASLQYVIRAI